MVKSSRLKDDKEILDAHYVVLIIGTITFCENNILQLLQKDQDKYRLYRSSSYRGMHSLILCFDISDEKSIDKIKLYHEEARRFQKIIRKKN